MATKLGADYRIEAQFQQLVAAYLAARLGENEFATALLSSVDHELVSDDYPMLANMLAVAQSQALLAKGKPNDAIRLIKSRLDGSELYLSHAVLMDSFVAAGDKGSALVEAEWLARRRGRAYAENNYQMLLPLNVALSGLAQRYIDGSTKNPAP
jgi:two-component SAPR family response regulator